MPWRPLPRIAFAVATYPFQPSSPADLPLELGDELYIIEQGGRDGAWYRGYLVAPPSLLAGLTCTKGQTLEARVFSGIFPASCVDVREELGDVDLSQKLTNSVTSSAHNGTEDSEARSGSPKVKENQAAESSPRSKKLARHESLKGLGLFTSQRQAQMRDGNSGSSHRLSSLLQTRSRNASQPTSQPTTPEAPQHPSGQPQKPAAPVPMLKIGDETPTSASEPLVDEISSCLREWHSTNLHELLLNRQYATLEKMSAIVSRLDLTRKSLLHDVLTAKERLDLRERAVWDLVRGNKMLNGEVIVRDPLQRGRLLTGDDSAIEMTKLQSVMSVLDSAPTSHTEGLALHHLLLEFKGVSGADTVPMTLTASLCIRTEDHDYKPLSETFALNVASPDEFVKSGRDSKLKTLFTDLSGADIGEAGTASNGQLYLVVRLQTSGQPRAAPVPTESRPPSRNGTLTSREPKQANGTMQDTLKGGRRSLMFGSIRAKSGLDRRKATYQNAQIEKQNEENPPAPISKDGPGLDATPPPKAKSADVPRTIAVGVLELKTVMAQDKDLDRSFTMWTPPPYDKSTKSEDEEPIAHHFGKLLYSPNGLYIGSKIASVVNVQVHAFTAPDAQSLIRSSPTTMHGITQTQKIGFSEAPTKSRSDIYITFSEAAVSQAAWLSHPELGAVGISRPSPFLNLQLTMEVRDSNGKRIENTIYPTSNGAGVTAWRTTMAEQGAKWDQTICLRIPSEQVKRSHLIMSIAEAPEFPFALTWMPLWDQQAFVQDGRHSLTMHVYDKSTSSVVGGKGAYLSLPWQNDDHTGHAATLVLYSSLCSTELSQDQVLLGLINWKHQPSAKLMDLLKKIVFVPEIEIVKQRNDLFNALFALLVHQAGEREYEALIFNDLVTVLGMVHDRRFNLGPLIDQYAEHDFDFPSAAPCLMRSFARLVKNASDPQQSRNLRATFKVGRYIMKFIFKARQQQKFEATNLVTHHHDFNQEMKAIFETLEDLMQNNSPSLIGSKTLVVQHFHTWLPELLVVFPRDEIIRIASRFMDASAAVTGRLVLFRILLVLHYVQADELWRDAADRQRLFSNCSRWLSPYWGTTTQPTEQWREQIRLCASVVAELLKHPGAALLDFMPKIVESYWAVESMNVSEKPALSLLFPQAYPFPSRPATSKVVFDEALLELAALMSAITALGHAARSAVSEQELPEYILSVLEAQKSVLESQAFPENWLSLHIYHHKSTLKTLAHVSALLTQSFLPNEDFAEHFDMEMWKAYFMILLKIVGSDALALETFPEQKRRAVWKIAGDARESGAELLRQSWETIGWEASPDENRRYGLRRLGGYQVQYVPSLVSPIVELCLSVHDGVRKVAVEILQTMIVSEWALNEDLGVIETEMIASLDLIFKTKRINEGITQKLFITDLLDLFGGIADQPDDALWVALKDLIGTIDELLDLLIAAHGDTMESSMHTLRLMDFMKDLQKEDIYIHYVHDLAKSQAEIGHSTEAGLALRLHADLYAWDSSKMLTDSTSPTFPVQSTFDRKEAIFFQMIQHFENGKAYMLALDAYRELAELYEYSTFDFAKLARTQRAMGSLNDLVAREERQPPRYFKVTYRGLGFPLNVRDKQYIYEGGPWERMAAFTDRMQKLHPTAQVTQSLEITNMEGQYVQVTTVSPQRDMEHPVNMRPRLSLSVKEHLLASNPKQFYNTSKRETSGINVKEHWVEKLVYTTGEAFPNITRQSEVVSTEEVRLSPIQTATERTWRKTVELNMLEKKAAAGSDANYINLTSALSKLLDIKSQSGSCLALYREFLTEPTEKPGAPASVSEDEDGTRDGNGDDSEESVTPARGPLETALYAALSDHAAAIKHCLSLYTRPSLQATKNDLSQRFDAVYPEQARLPSPPAPHVEQDFGSSPSGSEVHKPFVDQAGQPNGRVVTPESGRASRQSKSQHMSLNAIKGAAASNSLIDRVGSLRGARTGTPVPAAESALAKEANGTVGSSAPAQAPAPAPASVPTVVTSQPITSQDQQQETATVQPEQEQENQTGPKRRSFFGNFVGSSAESANVDEGEEQQAHDFVKDEEGEERPTTAGSANTTGSGSGRPGNIKRFSSIMRFGSKRSKASGRSVGVGSDGGKGAESDA